MPTVPALARTLLLALCLCAAGARAQAPEISAADARADLRLLQRAFTELHPGLYRYATPAQIGAEFAAAETAVAQGSSRAAMFLLASRLAAAVHCSHTWTNPANQGPAVVAGLFGRADKLPLTLRWIEGRARITGSMVPGLAAGTELLAIDGRPVAEIATALLPYLRADGLGPGSEGKQRSQLDSGPDGGAMDRLLPLLYAPRDGRWRLGVRETALQPPRELEVAAVTLAARDLALPAPGPEWTLAVEGDTGVLTLPTFAFWRSGFDARAFLDRSFATLRDVPYLIIDLRRNEGGDDAIASALLARLLRAPYSPPGARVESAYLHVPEDLRRHLDTWDRSFFDRSDALARAADGHWLLPQEAARRIAPAASPYAGRTVVLVGPQNSSAAFLLARDLQLSRAATLVGQTTGGNLRGLNAGQIAWLTLPASGVAVDIPLLAHYTEGDPPDSGVVPELAYGPRWSDVAAGIDSERVVALRVVQRWRQLKRLER